MANVPYGVETLRKISIVWVGCTNVTDDRQTTDGRTMTYSERELEFTFAKNQLKYSYLHKYSGAVTISLQLHWLNFLTYKFVKLQLPIAHISNTCFMFQPAGTSFTFINMSPTKWESKQTVHETITYAIAITYSTKHKHGVGKKGMA